MTATYTKICLGGEQFEYSKSEGTFGTNGVMYVDPSRIEKIIAKRGNRYEL